MLTRQARLGTNAHRPIKTAQALLAAALAAAVFPTFDWTASDLSTQYQDSGGTLPVTAVEQPAGLVLDRSKGGAPRGPEVIQNGDFSAGMFAWTSLHATATVSNGQLSMAGTPAGSTVIGQLNRLVIGATYEVSFDIVSISAGGVSVGSGSDAGNAKNTVGRHRDVIVAAAASCAVFARSVATTAVVDNISVRRIGGTNLWSGAPALLNGWTDNGDGSYSMAGGNGLLGWNTPKIVPGRVYECIMRVTARTAGSVAMPYDGTGANILYQTTTGTFRRILVAPANASLYIYSNGFAGTVDSITVVEVPGNHLIQLTSASRPTLTARVNLLTYSEQISHANWSKSAGGTGTVPTVTDNFGVAPDGTTTAARVQLAINGGTTTADISRITQPITGMPIGGTYTQGLWLKTNDGSTKVVQFRDDNAGTVGKNITVTGAWQYFSQDNTVSAGSTTVNAIGLWVRGTLGTADSADLLMWHPQFNIGLPIRYQRIAATTDYDSVGFAKAWRTDGVDDGWSMTSTVDMSNSPYLTVVAAYVLMAGNYCTLINQGTTAVADGRWFTTLNDTASSYVLLAGRRASGSLQYRTSDPSVARGTYALLGFDNTVATVAGGVVLKKDGVPTTFGTGPAITPRSGFTNEPIYVARNASGAYFNGLIYSLRGINRRTSPDESAWMEAVAKLDMNNNL